MARPRKQDALDIPRLAVEQSLRLLASRPEPELTLQEVADAIGCRPPALYNHFRNKEALLRAVREAGFRQLRRDKLARLAELPDPLERLRQGGYAYLAFAREFPALYRLLFLPSVVDGVEPDPFASEHARGSLDLLAATLEACQQAGYLPGGDARAYAATFWATVHGAALLHLQQRRSGLIGAYADPNIAVDCVMTLVAGTRTMTAPRRGRTTRQMP